MSKSSAFQGDILSSCPPRAFTLESAFAVTVSGAKWNPCGHLLLNAGGRGGRYFHVAERKGYPRTMDEPGYRRYLSENGKHELSRAHVPLANPSGAMLKLEDLMSRAWSWWVLPNNCATFVEDVLQAGGSRAGLYFNCPSREYFI